MCTSGAAAATRAPSLVSVVIAVRNGLPWIDEQLHALATQDYKGAFEVVVADNGSTDGLIEHLDDHPLRDRLRLRWIDASACSGVSFARNTGAGAADGDLLTFTDADDRAHPGWLTALVDSAATAHAVGGPVETATLNTSEIASWRPVPAPAQRFETQWLPYANGNNMAIWRSTFDTVGGYDENLRGGGDDIDISWRIQQSGLTLAHTPHAVMAYRLRTTRHATWRQAVGYGASAIALYRKHRTAGCPPIPLRHALQMTLLLVVHNPWIPLTRNPIPYGQWSFVAGVWYGRLTATVRHRIAALRSP